MDDDHRELANRLFAVATAMLEDMIGVTVAGQSPRLDAALVADKGHRLQTAAQDVAILAQAVAIVAHLGVEPPPHRRKRRR